MNYIVKRPTIIDHLLTLLFITASVIAVLNLPQLLATVFLANVVFIAAERALWMRARRRAFAAIGALQHLPVGVTAVSLFIPARERAL
jgi:hypothetical protein